MKWLDKLIKRQPKVIFKLCRCGQKVNEDIYNKRLKRHIMGQVFKQGKMFKLYCDGKERK